MTFLKEKPDNVFLTDTKIENIFVNEYIATAPGDYVKVFLVVSMYAETEVEHSNEEIAKILKLSEDDIEKALIYWEEYGALKRVNGDIVIVSLKNKVFGSSKKEAPVEKKESKPVELLDNKGLRDMYDTIEKIIKKPITPNDALKIQEWIKEFHAAPEIIVSAYAQAMSQGKDNINYVASIVKDWTSRGFKTTLDVEEHLERTDKRNHNHKRILKALGLFRNATEPEAEIMDKWLNEKGLSLQEVLEATTKTVSAHNPSIKYLDSIINNQGKDEERNTKIARGNNIEWLYAKARNEAENIVLEIKAEVESKLPELEQIKEEIIQFRTDILSLSLNGGADKLEKIDNINMKIAECEEKRKILLTKNNIPIDYDVVKYKCLECNDTGQREDKSKCSCYLEKQREVEEWQKNQSK